MIGNQEATEEIIDMKVGKRTESGHMPLEIEIEGPELQKIREKRRRKREKGMDKRKSGKILGGM